MTDSSSIVNDKWKHAGSANHIIKRKALEAEMEFLRGMFTTVLPVAGEPEKQAINDYFNKLKEVISTTDDVDSLPRDKFPDDDNEPTPGRVSDYKYFSPFEAKERSSRHHILPDSQDVADPDNYGESRSTVQIYDTEFSDLQRVQEFPEGKEYSHQG
jgi:hypothetical protein